MVRTTGAIQCAVLALWFILQTSFANHSQTMLVLNNAHWPPFLFAENKSEYSGFAKDILNVCLNPIDYKLKYINLPVKRIQLYMQSGVLDISFYSYKKEREEFVFYNSIPIFISEYGFAVAKHSNIQIKKLSDVANYTIGHLSGLAHTPELLRIIDANRTKQKLVESNDVDLMLKQLTASPARIEIIPNSKETFFWRIKQQQLENEVEVLDYTVAKKPYYITVSKHSKNIVDAQLFLEKIDRCLIQLKNSGDYQHIGQKYGLF